jgi:hypothetical protein
MSSIKNHNIEEKTKINKEKLASILGIKQNKITTFHLKEGIIYYSLNHSTKFKKIALITYNKG